MFWVKVCNVLHPACDAHAPIFHLWPARLYSIFPNHLTNDNISPPPPPKKKCYWKCNVCFDFLYKFCLTYSYYNKKWARYNQKYALVLMCSTRYSCLILMKPDFSRQIFQNDSNINFHEDSSIRSHGVPCGEKDRRADGETDNHDACKGRSSQFCESV